MPNPPQRLEGPVRLLRALPRRVSAHVWRFKRPDAPSKSGPNPSPSPGPGPGLIGKHFAQERLEEKERSQITLPGRPESGRGATLGRLVPRAYNGLVGLETKTTEDDGLCVSVADRV